MTREAKRGILQTKHFLFGNLGEPDKTVLANVSCLEVVTNRNGVG
jgi:hypothetical protein